jgi:hypothetical protein
LQVWIVCVRERVEREKKRTNSTLYSPVGCATFEKKGASPPCVDFSVRRLGALHVS